MKFKPIILFLFVSVYLLVLKPNLSRADFYNEFQPSASDYGGIGLFQTRTARFARDSTFEFSRSSKIFFVPNSVDVDSI